MIFEAIKLITRESENSFKSWKITKNKLAKTVKIAICNEHITITNPIDNHIILHIEITKNRIVISNQIINILTEKSRLSRPAILRYLNNTKQLGDSIWENIYTITPGTSGKIRADLSIRISIDIPKAVRCDPAETLTEVISKQTRGQNISVRFSGGIESTAILAACKAIADPRNIVATTWYSEAEGYNSDVSESSRIARILQIEHLLVPIDESRLFTIPSTMNLPAYPSPALAFSGILEILDRHATEHFGGRAPIVLDGHGGDHAFLEHPDPRLLRNCIGNNFFKKLNEYCDLNATSYSRVIKRILLGPEPHKNNILIKKYRKQRQFPDLTKTTNRLRAEIIQEALEEICITPSRPEEKILYPFLHSPMIECALAFEISEAFNSSLSRIAFRKSAAKAFGNGLFTRDNKGSVTGSFQKALSLQRERLLAIIENGYCTKEKLIDLSKFKSAYNISAQGAEGLNYEMMKILNLELLISYSFNKLKRLTSNAIF
ncbi:MULTISPECIES: asparagine synthase-related protein [Pseudomonas]|uniref:asparagine synthase-related protein n=1 Tax=Pseudomonas TaxID=286 RepID=UPI000DA77151|nr:MULTISPECIES: asparagine synthase-related protein [Pseudomonas]MDW3713783.1 asparagine synthase-related protein [Pseudomonas sp. 2023EL-01195]PZE09644.1 hypothetical protein DMX10_30100 [Pseudomonas sp. 57B-090624]